MGGDYMAKRGEEFGELEAIGRTGLGIDISLSNPKLEPQFRPVIDKITEVVREMTGTHCSEQVVARLRW
jgi:hypothetical protein